MFAYRRSNAKQLLPEVKDFTEPEFQEEIPYL